MERNKHPNEVLTNFSQEDLENWMAAFLKYGATAEVNLHIWDDPRSEVFANQIWDEIDSSAYSVPLDEREQFRRRIRQAVHSLIKHWSPPSEPPEYMLALLTLAGDLGCTNCLDTLLDFATEERLVGLSTDVDLVKELLRVVLFMPHRESGNPVKTRERSKKIYELLSTYIHDPAYSSLCLHKYWLIAAENGVKYMRAFIKSSLHTSKLALQGTLLAFHTSAKTGPSFFQKYLPGIRANLLRTTQYQEVSISPGVLYARYIDGISGLCTLRCKTPLETSWEGSLPAFLLRLLGVHATSPKEGFEVDWHPPGREELRLTFFIPCKLKAIDFILFRPVDDHGTRKQIALAALKPLLEVQ